MTAPTYPETAAPWADADLGRALRELVRTCRTHGYSRPGLVLTLDGWEASATRVTGRRFHHTLRHVSGDPVTAVETVAGMIEVAGA